LPRADPPQKRFSDQHRHLFRSPLKPPQPHRQKTLFPGACDAQPDGSEAGHKIPLVVSVAIGLLPAPPALVDRSHRVPVPLPLRLQFEKLLPGQFRLAIQIPPETLFHLCQEVLEVLADLCYLRHRV
jgi:hypothetical protein